ncbi:NodT family efflux transporter outer membrane factor (OMF) lipoprotein [Duganella sp. SG902]|uniref:efflux transporter outer membrane subunit n=1 Tax=Duganella sp. SG902 TaxID=2587016 RepID=UPI00159DA9D1|nr:efflux transporter outer membrane subunit [Duganella sp. SG902]NVM77500.1 NodT family efflux transporter outer membrane factor (OMF) lipoprotein [Duganella sp. SG902]
MYQRILLSICAGALAAGCTTVGPDYAGPPAMPLPEAFVRANDAGTTAQASAWWLGLNDSVLTGLVERAFAANPGLAGTRSRLRQARAMLQAERATQSPRGGAKALYAHARMPSPGAGGEDSPQLPSQLDLYNLGFDASWEIDLFGGQRRAVEAATASAQAAEADLADMQVSLAAEVVQVYVNLRSCQRRQALNEEAIARQLRLLDLAGHRRAAGTATELDLARLQGQLESTRADSPPLVAELDSYRNALAVLTGAPPGALDTELARPAPVPLPPAAVAVRDPATLLRNRPDIRAAERALAARTAQIGQADAARLPRLNLMGLVGIGGTRLSDLTHLDDFVALAAPQLSWNFLDFGRNASGLEKAQGRRDEAEARYRATVLAALRDTEDALTRFRQRRVTVATLARATEAAGRAADLTRARQHGGTATTMDLLDAERARINAEQRLASAEAALTNDFVSLHKSLGLGWSR